VQYLGIDWGHRRRAARCALTAAGELAEDAVWVRGRLGDCGWTIEIADARKVEASAPLACTTDRVDARVLADVVRRALVLTRLAALDRRAAAANATPRCVSP
jgi:hypothetical protein